MQLTTKKDNILRQRIFLRLQRRAGAAEHSPQLCLPSLLVQTPDGDKNSECKNMNMNSPGVDILDRQACNDIVHSELHSDEEKHQILQTNCLSLLQAVPFNFELATFCFSHSKFFQLKKEDNTLGMRMQQIVNIFNDEFKKELSKHHV